jgi:hypothetical protein
VLAQDGMAAWCRRGRANRIEKKPNGSRYTLVELAVEALRRASGDAREWWLAQIAQVQPQQWQTLMEETPRMSVASRRFASEILRINRERLLRVC